MAASVYGAYYYLYLDPHSMYMAVCSGLSLLLGGSALEYRMKMKLSVADAQLCADGEHVRLVTYDGYVYHTVPIASMCFQKVATKGAVNVPR